jgi:hypothetical protein
MPFADNYNGCHYISSGYFQNLPIAPQYVMIVDWIISDRQSIENRFSATINVLL